MNEKIVIIGAGPAGIEAAVTAANYSDDVTLVASSLVGEWKHADTSVWLNIVGAQSAVYSENKQSELLSIIHERVVEARNEWSNTTQKLLEELGVKLVYGIAEFVSSTCVQVLDHLTSKHQTIKADKIIIATGSRPMFPDEMKPDGRQIFSYHTLNQMKTLPKSMLIVGDGAIGFEAVNLFSR
jgi:pyruvate/2-oxoglutarate dehydrogenase complex dihydrolipoamide dehydrogenase (E3) component